RPSPRRVPGSGLSARLPPALRVPRRASPPAWTYLPPPLRAVELFRAVAVVPRRWAIALVPHLDDVESDEQVAQRGAVVSLAFREPALQRGHPPHAAEQLPSSVAVHVDHTVHCGP